MKHAMPTKKPATKYKTDEGDYLAVGEDRNYFRIYWHIKEWEEPGANLGETYYNPSAPPQKHKDKEEWESWQANHACNSLATGRDENGFYFNDKKTAREALRIINAALLSGDVPWPPWAIKAKAAGWTPPKNWKP